MPAINSINCANGLVFVDDGGEHSFGVSDIPADKDTVQKLEDYLNNEFLPNNSSGGYKIKVHVFSLSPLLLTAYTADLDVNIPNNWWE